MKCRKCKKLLPADSKFCNYCGQSQKNTKQNPRVRGNGQGSVYQLANGKWKAAVILYYYMDENGKEHKKTASKTFIRKKDAVAALAELKNGPTEKPKEIRLIELHNMYVKTTKYKELSKSQRTKLDTAWKRLSPIHGHRIVSSESDSVMDPTILSVKVMQETIDNAAKTYYPAREMKVMLSHLYTLAMKYEYCNYNKTENLDLPPLKKNPKTAFNELEVQKFWNDYYQGHFFTGYILIMIYCGLRYGEISTIALQNIFLNERYMVGGIKTDAGKNRRIPISLRILPVVKDLMQNRKRKLLEMNEDNFYTNYWETINRLDVQKIVPHSCRHTYFTMLASKKDIAPAVIAEMGGHADFDVTYKNYIHTPLDELLKAADLL